jgi:MoxR-like ATPase
VIQPVAQRILQNVQEVVIGKAEVIELALVAVLCEGHVLAEDVPGIGKTTLAKAVARSLGCSFRRIQFTPDLLPSDVTGIYYFNQKSGDFEYRAGPLQAQIVLADEINRATPRTQSALLEAMEERQVTVEGETKPLPRPFLVLATQNPIELEGTFPLPEAQLDRFLIKLTLGYPDEAAENEILTRHAARSPLDTLRAVTSPDEILALQEQARAVHVGDAVRGYIVRLARATREQPLIELGASPRASLALYRTSQALAAIRGRDYVLPDDVKEMAEPVLSHRLIISPQARLRGRGTAQLIHELVAGVPVPVEEPIQSSA